MLKSLVEFYQRHKRKILFTGLVAGGTYAVVRLASGKLEEWRNVRMDEISIETRKQYHFENNQRTCSMTYLQFLPNVRNIIEEKVDIENLLDILKTKPTNKLEIWEQLKILSVCSFICSIVVNILLLVFLKVELNIIGGYLFVKLSGNNKSEEQSDELKMRYLNNVRYLLKTGLPELVDDCMTVVEGIMKDVALNEKLSLDQLSSHVSNVIDNLKTIRKSKDTTKHPFTKYLIDPNWLVENVCEDDYTKMTSQTVDVLQGMDCYRVIDNALHCGVDQVIQHLRTSFVGTDVTKITSIEQCTNNLYASIELPVAKVIPILNREIHQIYKDGANEFLDTLYAQSHLREFSENIYEAFSKEYS